MAAKIETLIRTVRGLTEDRRFDMFQDPNDLVPFSPLKVKTYRNNPFLSDLDEPCQLLGVRDGKVIGRRNSFPSRIVANGVAYDTRISGSVFVDPSCRSSLYAISLLKQALKFPNGDLNINCMMSDQNRKFYELLGSVMLELVIYEAGGRWSRYCKRMQFKGWKKIAVKLVNQLAALTCFLFDRGRYANLPDWDLCETDNPSDEDLVHACELVKKDEHVYRQEITPEWIRWTMNCDFYANAFKKSYVSVYNENDFVGFALVRYGKRDKLVKVYEWQLAPKYKSHEAEFLSLVAKKTYRYGYRVQLAVGALGVDTVKRLDARFPRAHGNFAAVTMSSNSRFANAPGIKDPANWRVRLGMGDSSLW